MKKWLLSVSIKTRSRMIIGIATLSLIILGFASNYFLQMSKALNIMVNAERIYNIKYFKSLGHFNRFVQTQDELEMKQAIQLIDSANHMAHIFSLTPQFAKNISLDKLVDSLYSMSPEIFDNSKSNARVLASKVNQMVAMGFTQLEGSIEIAKERVKIGTKIKQAYQLQIHDSSTNVQEQVAHQNNLMMACIRDFAREIYAMTRFIEGMLFAGIIFLVLILAAITAAISFAIAKTITQPIASLSGQIKQLAKGDIAQQLKIENKDEIGELAIAANTMIDNLNKIANQAKIISTGDYSNDLVLRSDNDILGHAIQQMTVSLREISEQNKNENWLKSGIAQLNDILRGEVDLEIQVQNVIHFLCQYTGAKMGAVYLHDIENDSYKLTSSYAFTHRKANANLIKSGEGLVGQAAFENQMITISEVPEDYFRIHSALGSTLPKCVTVLPVAFQEKVNGVIELALINELNKTELEFLRQAGEYIGIAINTTIARQHMKALLIKTQEMASELQAQQEELRQSNEELEEQTRALRESESSLMAQQEELRQTNEELEEQSKALKASEESLQAQQEELRQTNEELEEQTKALQRQRDDIIGKNKELRVAQEDIQKKAHDLELSSQYKSEFLANMSHELRTPLNSILVLSQMLSTNKAQNLTEKQVEFASTINSSGKDLLELINDVLDLSKVESGMMELTIDDIKIASLKDDIEQKFSNLAINKGINFKVYIHEDLPEIVQTDSMRLMQVVKNFISNGIKYTEEGGVTVSIARADSRVNLSNSGLDPEHSVCISITDTGIGITPEKQGLIFEAFKQADGGISRKYGGTGLGLSISKNLAELLGGEIQLQSQKGKGSTFSLYIPESLKQNAEGTQASEAVMHHALPGNNGHAIQLKDQQAPVVFRPGKNGSSHQTSSKLPQIDVSDDDVRDDRKNINKGDKIILIIEDDPNFSQILFNLAHEKDFKCLLAKNGETGLHYADFYNPQAIVLDIGLPGIDGWEVMNRLKKNPETRHIPVHFMSASDKNTEAMKMGAIGYLSKPASLETLNSAFACIQNVVTKSVQNLLIVEDDEVMRKSMAELIDEENLKITAVATGKKGLEKLKTGAFDCMILDLGLKDISGFDLLEQIRHENTISKIPIIIYTGRDLNREEEARLKKYASSIIIKGAHSPERLISETSLFLHQIESKLPKDKQKMLDLVHDKEATLSGKKVLIVDDDMRNVFALSSVLEDSNIKVVVGKNGKEGIEQLQKNSDTHLVLMDIMMPEMNGYEATEAIRKMPKFKNIPIIALTAKAMKGDRDKCIQAGANDYLTKPVDADKLISLLRVWMYK